MDNRYLYKAKRVDNGEWVTGYYVKGSDMYGEETHVIFEPDAIFYSHGETDGLAEIDPSTICQCTGLEDKNGKLIWENDIFQCTDETMVTQKDLIEYNETHASFVRLRNTEKLGLQYLWIDEATYSHGEVIGNVFDNPELLEGKVNDD